MKYTNIQTYLSDNEFPYRRLNKSDADIKKMFMKLKKKKFNDRILVKYYKIHNIKINTNNLTFLGMPRILLSLDSDYTEFNILSDMFQEKNRLKCKFFSADMSPYDYYKKNAKTLASETLNKYGYIDNINIRDELYFKLKECSSFKPLNLIYLIKLFNVKSVLDPCSGWGDRLIASMACDIRYVGVDPNNELHPVYDQMIDFFMPKKKTKYTMINDTIQEAKLPNEKFDMVFTSPPYFKIEQYQNRGVVTDTNEYDWFENFMKPMITKTCKKLKNGGYMVLVINQLPGDHYIQKMLDYAYSIGLYYLGVISYANTKLKNPQPMWIWQRCNTIPTMLYNPPIVITNHVYKNIKFKVFRDDYLIGGTKQRALVPLLQKINKEKFIYAGPSQGFAQLALAYAGKLTRKKVVLFLGNQTPITKLALTFNSPELHEIHGGYLKKLQEKAEIYNKNNSNSHLVAFGGDEPMFIKLLETNLKKAMPKIKPNRIWLVAGSATVLKVLYKIFPKTKFMVVQVGKTIWPDQIKPERTTLFISNESFMSVAIEQPPYPTVKTYDAKLWTFFKEYGKSGDYIFNIAKDPL